MNPKHLKVRLDKDTGNLWLTLEKYAQPIKRVADITNHVLLAFAADIVVQDDTQLVTREVQFADGTRIRLTVEELPPFQE